jgi:hypothetical protein
MGLIAGTEPGVMVSRIVREGFAIYIRVVLPERRVLKKVTLAVA